MRFDRGLLTCDMAETYHIHDMRQFKPSYIALLAVNLPYDSRIMRKLSGYEISVSDMLLGYIADKVANIVWMFSEDGARRQNPPASILALLLGKENKKDDPVVSYDSPEEFLLAMRKYE